jgi:predicted dehydrogenase
VVERRILPEWGDPFEAEWRAFHASVVDRTQPTSSPADFREDLELFRDMVELMAAADSAVVT